MRSNSSPPNSKEFANQVNKILRDSAKKTKMKKLKLKKESYYRYDLKSDEEETSIDQELLQHNDDTPFMSPSSKSRAPGATRGARSGKGGKKSSSSSGNKRAGIAETGTETEAGKTASNSAGGGINVIVEVFSLTVHSLRDATLWSTIVIRRAG